MCVCVRIKSRLRIINEFYLESFTYIKLKCTPSGMPTRPLRLQAPGGTRRRDETRLQSNAPSRVLPFRELIFWCLSVFWIHRGSNFFFFCFLYIYTDTYLLICNGFVNMSAFCSSDWNVFYFDQLP